MPELPEVETTRRGLKSVMQGMVINSIEVHKPQLRWQVPTKLPSAFAGVRLTELRRRSKYLLLDANNGQTLLVHLGMSGRLHICEPDAPLEKHAHVIWHMQGEQQVRLIDPRRFGAVLYAPTKQLQQHPLLKDLGPEPLGEHFTANSLHTKLAHRQTPVKAALMNAQVVVGVGNIYASESLFTAGIHPQCNANQLSRQACAQLVTAVQQTLQSAIAAGGSSLRDYKHGNGQLGYFQHQFNVYGRAGEPCRACGHPIEKKTIAQRATYFCPHCQPA